MDEIGFGPRREIRLPPRYRRILSAAAAVVAAGALTAGAAFAVTAVRPRHPASAPGDAGGPATAPAARAGCPPARAARPSLAALPAGMRPGALKVIIDAQYSGRCPASR